jgi:hypothetical protein
MAGGALPFCAPPLPPPSPSRWLMMESMSMRRDSSVCTAPHASKAAIQFMRPFFEAIISAVKPCRRATPSTTTLQELAPGLGTRRWHRVGTDTSGVGTTSPQELAQQGFRSWHSRERLLAEGGLFFVTPDGQSRCRQCRRIEFCGRGRQKTPPQVLTRLQVRG